MSAQKLFIAAYLALIRLFPRNYRREYETELAFVIRQATEATNGNSQMSFLRLAWRELRDLPIALFREHLRERRRRRMEFTPPTQFPEEPLSGRHLLLAFAPFAFAFALQLAYLLARDVAANTWQATAMIATIFALLTLLLITAGIGLRNGLPRWALPGLGLTIGIAGLILLSTWGEYLPSPTFSRAISGKVWQGLLWRSYFYGSMLSIALLLLFLTALVPSLRSFNARVRRDWSMLSFLLYGAPLLTIIIGNDPYRGMRPYQIASLAVLAAGAWAYLRATQPVQRVVPLLIAVLSSLGVMSLATYTLYPQQAWVSHTAFPRWWEATQPLLDAAVLLVLLCVPAVLRLLPHSQSNAPA